MSPWAVLSVVALLAAFAGLSAWVRRWGRPPAPRGNLKIEDHQRLDAQLTVWIVEVDGRRLLLGGGRDGVRLLTELSPPSSASPPP